MGACELHFNNTLLGRSFNCLLFLSPQNSSRNELWPVFGGLAMFWATGHQPAGLPLQTELILLFASWDAPISCLHTPTSAFWILPRLLLGKVLFTSPVNTQTPFKTGRMVGHDVLHTALPPWLYGSHTVWFSNEGPSWGPSLPCKEMSLIGDIPGWILELHSKDLFHVLISSSFFQGCPCQSQSHERSKIRACTSASPARAASFQPSQEALQYLLSAAGSSVYPLLLSSAPHPVFWGWLAHATCSIPSPKLNNPTEGTAMGPWPTARQKQSSKPCTLSTDHILPILPALLTRTDPCDVSQ